MLFVILMYSSRSEAEELPNVLLAEARYFGKNFCIHRKTQYDCHLVNWKGDMYLVMTLDRQAKYVTKSVKGKVVEVWRHDDIST